MKKKVLCVFSLILYILIACTLLSEKIEVEMQTQAEVWTVKATSSFGGSLRLSTGYLFGDAEMKHLFEVAEGTGWESGLRAQEISDQNWKMNYDSEVPMVELTSIRDYTFIRTASRFPQSGELVEIIEEPEIAPDSWLIYYPDGVPEYEQFPSEMELIAESDNALLLKVERSKYPFFEHRAIGDDLKQIEGNGMRVFSLTTVEGFVNQIPALAMVFILLVIPVILWAVSCFLSIHTDRNKWLIAVNIAAVLASLFLLRSTLSGIDLPAAMLPSGNILNWAHYNYEFSLVLRMLEKLADQSGGILLAWNLALDHVTSIFIMGILIAAVIILAEVLVIKLICRRRAVSTTPLVESD